jgi:hypothetical protein
MFTTVEGHVATPEEFKNLTANSQRDLVFLVARFHWIDGDSGRDFYFDSCQFIAGDPGAVFTCDGHNGPVRPGQ